MKKENDLSCEYCEEASLGHVEGHGHHELSFQEVGASYGTHRALEKVRFSICCGRRLALLGPNGAGKSTLIRLLCGLMIPDKGRIVWRGKPLNKATREIAYLPQFDQHAPNFPIQVEEVVAMGRYPHVGLWRSFSSEDADQVEKALSLMNLDPLRGRLLEELSGGQRQRTFIARALAQEAHVIVLDEPFNGLDVESKVELGETLRHLADRGHLIVSSHHQLSDLKELFDDVLVLNKKQVAFESSTNVLNNPQVRSVLSLSEPH